MRGLGERWWEHRDVATSNSYTPRRATYGTDFLVCYLGTTEYIENGKQERGPDLPPLRFTLWGTDGRRVKGTEDSLLLSNRENGPNTTEGFVTPKMLQGEVTRCQKVPKGAKVACW